jgi:uncharacterized protein YecT (DUF1311 family)
MKKRIFIITIFIFLSFSNTIFAQTQLEMNQTAQRKYEKADKELNKVYSILIKSLDKTEAQILVKAQKCWIKFRDSHCEFESSQYEGGSIQPLIYSTCLEELTKKRIAELNKSIKDRDN